MIFKKKPEQMTSLPASPELRTHGGPCLPFLGPPLAGLPSWPQSVSATGQEALPPAAFAPRVPWARNWIFSILHLSQIHLPRKPFLTAQPKQALCILHHSPHFKPHSLSCPRGLKAPRWGTRFCLSQAWLEIQGHACFAHQSWTLVPGTGPGGSSINTAQLVSQLASPYDIYIILGPNVIVLKETKAPNLVPRARLSFSKGLSFLVACMPLAIVFPKGHLKRSPKPPNWKFRGSGSKTFQFCLRSRHYGRQVTSHQVSLHTKEPVFRCWPSTPQPQGLIRLKP